MLGEVPELDSQRREDEQIQDSRGEQASEDDNGHRPFDFATGFTGTEGQRQQTQAGDQCGHEDRNKALGRTAQSGVDVPVRALASHEVLVVRNEHDGVAHCDTKQRDEPHERAEVQTTFPRFAKRRGEPDSQHSTHERERNVGQDEQNVRRAAQDDGQQENDAHCGDGRVR